MGALVYILSAMLDDIITNHPDNLDPLASLTSVECLGFAQLGVRSGDGIPHMRSRGEPQVGGLS